MRWTTIGATAAVAVMLAQVLVAQTKMTPTAPGTSGDPVWQGVVRSNDGRTFVTDGGLIIDAALAKPAKLPEREFPSRLLDTYFGESHKDEYGLSDLTEVPGGKTYRTPSGMALNATYINYLRRTLSSGSVRLRMTGGIRPIVIVVNGALVGAFMPVQQ